MQMPERRTAALGPLFSRQLESIMFNFCFLSSTSEDQRLVLNTDQKHRIHLLVPQQKGLIYSQRSKEFKPI